MVDINQLKKQIQALEKGDGSARRQAIQSLRAHEEKDWAAVPAPLVQSVVESLLHQLPGETKPPFMHKEVAIILGKMGPRSKDAIPHLIQFLDDGVPDSIRETAVAALGRIGKDAKPAVERLVALTTGRNALAIQAVRALAGIGVVDSRVRAALIEVWAGPIQTQNYQVQVAMALCKLEIDARGLFEVLTTTLMTSQDVALRKAAAEALGYCGKNDPNVVPALLAAALGDKNDEVKDVARKALEQMGVTQENAVVICAKQLKDSSYAEAALRKSGPLAVPALIKAIASDDSDIRMKAARILACGGELAAAAVPSLTASLRDRDAEIRLAAAKALWNISKNPDPIVPVLIQLLQGKPPTGSADAESGRKFILTVIEALWRIGPPAIAARAALMAKTKDKNRLVSESAINALKNIVPAELQKSASKK